MIGNIFDLIDHKLSKQDNINLQKEFNFLKHEAQIKSKSEYCYICKQKFTSFCNSHAIPKFCLKSIANNGKVMNSFTLFDTNLHTKENGVNDAGTFHLLCERCDNKFFKTYESPENYVEGNITNRMLAQIAVKNYLRLLSKRLLEYEIYKDIEIPFYDMLDIRTMNKIDLEEFRDKMKRNIEYSRSEHNNYYIIFSKKLNYVVPIAFQSALTLYVDFNGELINDIYNKDVKYKIQNLHICIFPMKEFSYVLMFIEDGDNRYRKFYKQFKKLSEIQQLNVITYLMLLYSEDYYFNENLLNQIDLKQITQITRLSPSCFSNEPLHRTISFVRDSLKLSNWISCPNILSKEFALKTN